MAATFVSLARISITQSYLQRFNFESRLAFRHLCRLSKYCLDGRSLRLQYIHCTGSKPIFSDDIQAGCNTKSSKVRNVFLMGNPGSGKTTIAPLVAERLGMISIDIDNDFLEKQWGCSVANKLAAVGGEQFISDEGSAVLRFSARDAVVSLSGSNPLHSEAMKHIRSLGVIVYLDVPHPDIIDRLHNMKVDRIVSPPATAVSEEKSPSSTDSMSMTLLLSYRQPYYEHSYDIRIICVRGETPESIANKICLHLNRYWSTVDYVSTRGDSDPCSWNIAVVQGQPADGGLYIPSDLMGHSAQLSLDEWQRLAELNYQSRALRILERLIPHRDEASVNSLRSFIEQAYTREAFKDSEGAGARVRMLGERIDGEFVNELFHGPTGSFKDISLQLFPHLFNHALAASESTHKVLLVVATSGDTGSAVAHGFTSIDNDRVKVLILYPKDGVTELQRQQLLAARSSCVHVVAVRADFDFCQSIVKFLLSDSQLAKNLLQEYNTKLSVANSINWLRLILQTVHHASGYLDLVKQGHIYMGQEIDIAVPTGNFGNIYAAFHAKLMGLPIRKLICASNSNNVLSELINTGYYNLRGRQMIRTVSPAIDILHSSNFERLLYDVSGCDGNTVQQLYQKLKQEHYYAAPAKVFDFLKQTFLADWCNESACLSKLKDTYQKTGYVIDTHTAVAYAMADKFKINRRNVPLLLCATAHFSKSAAQVIEAIDADAWRSLSKSSITQQLDYLDSLNLVPGMHGGIRDSVKQTMQPDVIEPDRDVIVKRIHSILKH